MNTPYPAFSHLGDISIREFLHDYWQKKPLLIRNAFPHFNSPLSADELAGLALEDGVVSRLITQDPTHDSWTVEHGPLHENRFSSLPASHWSLLVQHVDSLDPGVNDLLQAFRFIPNWRLDDIMVSYATDRAGVGPHFDYFDVFLLQGEGRRRWRIGQSCNNQSLLVPDIDMKILRDFETTHDWIVEPGDLIYIPAQTAHWGEAIGESVTFSIGFRSPSDSELLLDFSQEIALPLNEDYRYKDPELCEQDHPGEISEQTIEKLTQTLLKTVNNKKAMAKWLGEYSTELKMPLEETHASLDLMDTTDFSNNIPARLSPFCRSAYFATTPKEAQLYVNGESYLCSMTLAKKISSNEAILYSALTGEDTDIVNQLIMAELMVYDETHVPQDELTSN